MAGISQKFQKFLDKHRVNKNDNKTITHSLMGPPFGAFSIIEPKEYKKFIKFYKKEVKNGNNNLSFVERPAENGQHITDIDFKVPGKYSKRQYKKKHIKKMVKYHNQVFKKYFDIDDDQLEAWILEKDEPTYVGDKDEYKDGFHIIYPHITSPVKHRYFVYEMVKRKMEESNPFNDIPTETKIDDILDKCVVEHNGILMFGSAKPKRTPYELTRIFDSEINDLDISELTTDDIIDTIKSRGVQMKINEKENKDINNFTETEIEKQDDEDEEEEELITSMKEKYMDTELVKQIFEKYDPTLKTSKNNQKTEKNNQKTENKSKEYNKGKGDENEIRLAKKLVDIMKYQRAENYGSWIAVGWALRNVDQSLLEDFKRFSRKCPEKYNEQVCENIWREARHNGGYTIASLKWWARTDSPENYFKILVEENYKYVNWALSGTHDDMANLLYGLYKDFFVCTSPKKQIWYEFKKEKSKWVMIDGAYSLRNKLTSEVVIAFIQYKKYLDKKQENNVITNAQGENDNPLIDNNDSNKDKRLAERLNNIIKWLKTKQYQSAVLEQAGFKFYDDEFEEKLDSNKDLLAFDNGVLDTSKEIFRETIPEDYIQTTTNYDYEEFSMDSEEVKFVEDFFSKVHPNEKIRNYVLTLFASCCDGYLRRHRVPIFLGKTGSNSKSTQLRFISNAFGKYKQTVSSTMFTRDKIDHDKPDAETYKCKSARLVDTNESSKSESFNMSILKERSGEDPIPCRLPHAAETITYIPQYIILMVCNSMPKIKIDENDGGGKRRLAVVPHNSKFLEPEEYEKYKHLPGYFLGDDNISEKISEPKNYKALMWYLINVFYFPIYKKYGIVEPEEVKQSTKDYHCKNDIYLQFINEELEITNKAEDYVTSDSLYTSFCKWFSNSGTHGKKPSRSELVEYFIENEYSVDKRKKYVLGLKLLNSEGDDDDE